jgi:hypothetical protein
MPSKTCSLSWSTLLPQYSCRESFTRYSYFLLAYVRIIDSVLARNSSSLGHVAVFPLVVIVKLKWKVITFIICRRSSKITRTGGTRRDFGYMQLDQFVLKPKMVFKNELSRINENVRIFITVQIVREIDKCTSVVSIS